MYMSDVLYRCFVLENYSEFKIKTDRSHRRLQTWKWKLYRGKNISIMLN